MPDDMLPVIHAGALELSIVEFETERFDEMKFGASGGAEASDVASVGRDFGFKEYDVHRPILDFGFWILNQAFCKRLSRGQGRGRGRSCRPRADRGRGAFFLDRSRRIC